MPTTPIYAFRYPAASDPANVPADMQNLATDVETAIRRGGEVSYGTTLPASPVDGQEAVLVDSTTNPSYQWRFRYNAGSSSPYKWEFVGGAPLSLPQSGSHGSIDTGGGANFIDLSGTPTFTIPRAGDYHLRFGAVLQTFGTVQGNCNLAPFLGAVQVGVLVQAMSPAGGPQYSGSTGSLDTKLVAVAASTLLKLRVSTSSPNWSASLAFLSITPMRVA